MEQTFAQRQPMSLREAGDVLLGVATLLEAQGANPYRVRAYRRAGRGLHELDATAGADHETTMPWIGPRLRRTLGELALRGRAHGAGAPPQEEA